MRSQPNRAIEPGSAYHLYGKPGNAGEKRLERFIPVEIFREKSNTFRGITFSLFLLKRPKFSVPFGRITSARLPVERKRKINRYFVNGTTQYRFCFRCQKKIPVPFDRNFRINGKRSRKIIAGIQRKTSQVFTQKMTP